MKGRGSLLHGRSLYFIIRNRANLAYLFRRCNVSPSPTDVSPTENSWMLHPLDKVSLDHFSPDRTIPSLNSDLIRVLCVGRACIRRRGANPINLIRGVGEAGQTSHWSIRCRGRRSKFHAWRGPGSGHIGQGHNIQGTLSSRGATSKNFRRGHIGQGHINPASFRQMLMRQIWRKGSKFLPVRLVIGYYFEFWQCILLTKSWLRASMWNNAWTEVKHYFN
jgi:hypothetical protein